MRSIPIKALPQKGILFLKNVTNKGFFHLLTVNFLVQFLGFGTTLLVTKFLSPVELGQIKILQSYTTVFWVIAGFGFNSVVLKYCSENRSAQEREGILLYSLLATFLTILVTLVIFAILTISGILASTPDLSRWLLIYGLVIPFGVLTDLLAAYLQSLKKIKEMARIQGFIKLQSFILIVVSTWLFGISGFIYATIAAYLFGLIPFFWQIGFGFLKTSKKYLPVGALGIALFSVLANGVGTLRQFSDIFILDHFTQNRVEIGYYSLATIFILAATQIIATIQLISTPYFSERSQDKIWFRNKLKSIQIQTMAVSFGIAIVIFILAWLLVQFFFGIKYASTLTYLTILLIKFVITSSYAILGIALFSLGLVKYNFLASLVTMVFAFGISYLFLINFGIIGIAWAQVLAALINLFLLAGITFLVIRKRQES